MLIGFMAVGKSKIGSMLAARLKLPFVDTDREIEAAFGLSVRQIFEQAGEAEFRRAERELIANLVGMKPQVVALGGGAYLDPDSRLALSRHTTVIWLDPPFEIVAARLTKSNTRPLASGKSRAELGQLWEQRREVYAQAHLRIPASDGSPTEVVDKILGELANRA